MTVNYLETKLGCLAHCRQSQVSKGCGNRRHSTTSFSKNVVVAETRNKLGSLRKQVRNEIEL